MMYYTDFVHGASFIECAGNQMPTLIQSLPRGSDVPLPPNPALEDMAMGHHHHHHGMAGGKEPEPAAVPQQPVQNTAANIGQQNTRYGNQRSGRYPDLNRYDSRFLHRPYGGDSYDYYSLGGGNGGGGDNFGGRDYFYDEVANQRSRYRRPSLDRYDNDNDDSAGAFFGFNDNDDDTYYNSQGQGRTYRGRGGGQPSMSYSDRMSAYDLIDQQPSKPSQPSQPSRGGGHAESMHPQTGNKLPPSTARRPPNGGQAPKLTPRISAKKGPHPGGPMRPTRKPSTVAPSPHPIPTSKSSINKHVKTHSSKLGIYGF